MPFAYYLLAKLFTADIVQKNLSHEDVKKVRVSAAFASESFYAHSPIEKC